MCLIEADDLEGGGVDHSAPLRARTAGLLRLKQSFALRLTHPLMLRQTLKLLQHLSEHPASAALLDRVAAAQAELQDWKSLEQTRGLWLPKPQASLAGLID